MKRDYYEILGLSKTASAQEIKTVYRKLAIKYHPDRNDGDLESEEKFKEIAEAYSVLSDVSKREKYDMYGHDGLSQGDVSYDINDVFSGLSDIFGAFFGGGDPFGGGRRRPTRGNDLQYNLTILFDEAYKGTEKAIRIQRNATCNSCGGTGLSEGASRNTCHVCRGRGQVAYSQGFFTMSRTCHNCGGSGEIIDNPCSDCHGKGRKLQEDEVTIKIPAGIDDGNTLRVTGKGEAGANNGPYGDLYIVVDIEEHKYFKRQGADVLLEIPISFAEAALGVKREIPTPGGKTDFEIPSGIQSGTVLELRGEGFPKVGEKRKGSLFVKVQLKTPKKVSGRKKELFEELMAIEMEEVDSVWEKFKSIFT